MLSVNQITKQSKVTLFLSAEPILCVSPLWNLLVDVLLKRMHEWICHYLKKKPSKGNKKRRRKKHDAIGI